VRKRNGALDSERRLVLVLLSLFVLTPAMLFLSCFDWSWVGYDFRLGYSSFERWPWIRLTLVSSLITILASFAIPLDTRPSFVEFFIWGGYLFPMVWLLLYPDHRILGAQPEGSVGRSLLLVTAIHGLAFALLRRAVAEIRSRSSGKATD
jgi:hypothetical protein